MSSKDLKWSLAIVDVKVDASTITKTLHKCYFQGKQKVNLRSENISE